MGQTYTVKECSIKTILEITEVSLKVKPKFKSNNWFYKIVMIVYFLIKHWYINAKYFVFEWQLFAFSQQPKLGYIYAKSILWSNRVIKQKRVLLRHATLSRISQPGVLEPQVIHKNFQGVRQKLQSVQIIEQVKQIMVWEIWIMKIIAWEYPNSFTGHRGYTDEDGWKPLTFIK